MGEKSQVLLERTGSPDGAEGAQAAVILADGEEAPRRLPSGQEPPHVVQGLLPQVVRLHSRRSHEKRGVRITGNFYSCMDNRQFQRESDGSNL